MDIRFWDRRSDRETNFKVSNWKLGLVIHRWKRLFKTVNLVRVVFLCDDFKWDTEVKNYHLYFGNWQNAAKHVFYQFDCYLLLLRDFGVINTRNTRKNGRAIRKVTTLTFLIRKVDFTTHLCTEQRKLHKHHQMQTRTTTTTIVIIILRLNNVTSPFIWRKIGKYELSKIDATCKTEENSKIKIN